MAHYVFQRPPLLRFRVCLVAELLSFALVERKHGRNWQTNVDFFLNICLAIVI